MEQKTKQQVHQKVSLKGTKEIDLPSLDVSKYIGWKTKIAQVSENQGQFGYFIKIETDVLEVVQEMKDPDTGKPLQLRASRVFGLQEDSEGNVGWGKQTKLGQFLEKMKCKHYNDLVGKEVIVQTVTNKNDGRDYLTFN